MIKRLCVVHPAGINSYRVRGLLSGANWPRPSLRIGTDMSEIHHD